MNESEIGDKERVSAMSLNVSGFDPTEHDPGPIESGTLAPGW